MNLLCMGVVAAGCVTLMAEEIPTHRLEQIREAVPDQPQVAPGQVRRVLIWNTPFMEQSPHKGWCIPYGTAAMRLLGDKTGAYTPVVSDDVVQLLPGNLARFDAMILNNSNGPWIRPQEADLERLQAGDRSIDDMEQVLRKSLLDWVHNGGGLVALHHGIAANTHWPEFLELLGARYDGHPWNEEVGLVVEEPDHPVLAAFGGKNFSLSEEIFQFREPYDRGRLRVLLSLDTQSSNMKVPWINRTDRDFALAWVKAAGKGRVFYTAIGHRTEHYWNPVLLQFFLDGIQFATGDLDAPALPRP